MSLDQYLSVKILMWRVVHFKHKQAYIVVSMLCLLIMSLNLNILFTFGYETDPSSDNFTLSNSTTSKVICFYNSLYPVTKWMSTWGTVHLFIYSIFPFMLIIILNVTLIVFLLKRKKLIQPSSFTTSREEINSSKAIGQTVMVASLLFVVFTLPSAIASHFYSDLIMSDIGSTYLILSNCLSFSYHGLNFFLFYLTNKVFGKEAQIVLKNLREKIKKKFLFEFKRFSNSQ
jgi:hypothetical protein